MYNHWLSIQECPKNTRCDLAIANTTLHCAHGKLMVGKVTRNKLIYATELQTAEEREGVIATWRRYGKFQQEGEIDYILKNKDKYRTKENFGGAWSGRGRSVTLNHSVDQNQINSGYALGGRKLLELQCNTIWSVDSLQNAGPQWEE